MFRGVRMFTEILFITKMECPTLKEWLSKFWYLCEWYHGIFFFSVWEDYLKEYQNANYILIQKSNIFRMFIQKYKNIYPNFL